MKVLISLKPVREGSKGRGVGVYTRELTQALTSAFPSDAYTLSSKNESAINPDIIHYPYFDPFFLTMPWVHSKPCVVTIHDLIPLVFPEHYPAGIRGRLKWVLQSRAVQKAAAIITDSDISKRDIARILGYSEESIYVVPLGPTDTPTKLPSVSDVKKKYALPDEYILYVGDINWNKNVVGLIEAFARISSKSLHLVLAGKSLAVESSIPEYRAVEDAIEKSGKKDMIHRPGFVTDEEKYLLYSQARAYVQPSWYEGFGLPVLDAMKWGCPVVCSNQGSLPEVGGDAVLYCDPSVKGEMTKMITTLCSDEALRKSLSAKAKLRAAKFSWEKAARLTHEVYEKVLG